MTACEKCWAEAFTASRIGPESQAEAYHRLLKENEGKPGHTYGWLGEKPEASNDR